MCGPQHTKKKQAFRSKPYQNHWVNLLSSDSNPRRRDLSACKIWAPERKTSKGRTPIHVKNWFVNQSRIRKKEKSDKCIWNYCCPGRICPPGALGKRLLLVGFFRNSRHWKIIIKKTECSYEAGKIYVIDLAIWKRFVQELASNPIQASSYSDFFPKV